MHRCSLFKHWCSSAEIDQSFGAYGPFLTQNLSGKNTFFILHWLSAHDSNAKRQAHRVIKEWVSTKKSTRVLMIAPRDEVENWLHPKDKQVLELALIPQLPFSYCMMHNNAPHFLHLLEPTSIVLFVNKESMQLDPIDWPAFKSDLTEWAHSLHIELSIPDWTNKLFLERAFPTHHPRASEEGHESGCVYQFLDPFALRRSEEKHMIECGVPANLARLLDRANRHDYALSTLGILPNQLRTILQESTESPEEVWLDVNRTMFWAGYDIWKKRKQLVSAFWKHIAPTEWNRKSKDSRKRNHKKANPPQCVDPFHFLPKTHDFTKQRQTKCPCSITQRPMHRTLVKDIRTFATKYPKITFPNIMLSYRQSRPSTCEMQGKSHNFFITRSDHVRAQHDRGKRKLSVFSSCK